MDPPGGLKGPRGVQNFQKFSKKNQNFFFHFFFHFFFELSNSESKKTKKNFFGTKVGHPKKDLEFFSEFIFKKLKILVNSKILLHTSFMVRYQYSPV